MQLLYLLLSFPMTMFNNFLIGALNQIKTDKKIEIEKEEIVPIKKKRGRRPKENG